MNDKEIIDAFMTKQWSRCMSSCVPANFVCTCKIRCEYLLEFRDALTINKNGSVVLKSFE